MVGLTVSRDEREFVPSIVSVLATSSVDVVRLRMLPGQTVEDYYTLQAPRLARTFGAAVFRIHFIPGRAHELALCLLIVDPLIATVDPLPQAAEALAEGLPVARVEDGTIWRLILIGFHILIVGATRTGKGSVISSIICQLADSSAKVW